MLLASLSFPLLLPSLYPPARLSPTKHPAFPSDGDEGTWARSSGGGSARGSFGPGEKLSVLSMKSQRKWLLNVTYLLFRSTRTRSRQGNGSRRMSTSRKMIETPDFSTCETAIYTEKWRRRAPVYCCMIHRVPSVWRTFYVYPFHGHNIHMHTVRCAPSGRISLFADPGL